MNKIIPIIGLFLGLNAMAQIQGEGGQISSVSNNLPVSNYQHIEFLKPNIKELQAEDAINDKEGNAPWRFGFNYETNLSLENAGTWFLLPTGGKIWLLRINCLEAQTVNLTFENSQIPAGNGLYIYNPEKSFILGKFTQQHFYKGELGTELVPGGAIVVEYYVAPENSEAIGVLQISKVTYGYRTAEEFQEKAFGQSGACEMNVNCPDGIPFSNQKRSVVMLVSGGNGFCSGALLNNTAYDGKPYILTANHCYSNPTSWVFRFNWEASGCSNPGSSPAFQSLSGAVLRAKRTPSDFCLVEITGGLESGTVPTAFNAFFSGWDRTGANPSKTFSIHHPKGDIKKISFDDDASSPAQSTFGGTPSEAEGLWRVQWDRSTATEGGSSGSSLFNQDKRVIGQLWGGQSSCSNLTGPDYYGRFSKSWNPTGSNDANQLMHWLDPSSSGAFVVDGYDPNVALPTSDGSLIALTNASGTQCASSITPQFKLTNLGQTTLTAATITYGIDGNEDQTYNWSGSLSFLQSEDITLPAIVSSGGSHTFSATITTVNGGADEVAENNVVVSSFYIVDNPQNVTLDLTLDCYASETSWEIKNTNGVVLFANPNYSNSDEGLHTYSLCLSEGCYTFSIYDSYSDGMSYCDSGKVQMLGPVNETLVSMTRLQAATFGASYTANFCVGDLAVEHLSNELLLYPNPSSGILNWTATDVQTVEIYAVNGKKTTTLQVIDGTQRMDLQFLSEGIYIAEFTFLNGTKTQRKITISK